MLWVEKVTPLTVRAFQMSSKTFTCPKQCINGMHTVVKIPALSNGKIPTLQQSQGV